MIRIDPISFTMIVSKPEWIVYCNKASKSYADFQIGDILCLIRIEVYLWKHHFTITPHDIVLNRKKKTLPALDYGKRRNFMPRYHNYELQGLEEISDAITTSIYMIS